MTDLFTNQFSDNIRMARSKAMIEPVAGTYNLIRIPRFAFLSDVVLWVKVGGSSDTLDIGIAGNGVSAVTDFFLDASTGEVDVTSIGYNRAKHDFGTSDYAIADGYYFQDASGMITATIATTQTTGEFIVFATYMIIH